ncbi:helix-turn-helix transcriptional regulator [Streptomyces sp. NPDC052020]|uniref:helix-turn-helix transcriptional regulator n=1 Tax=Streptomyces sp. NPDC052020 TaxID=3155677 RepID=UPI0034296C45
MLHGAQARRPRRETFGTTRLARKRLPRPRSRRVRAVGHRITSYSRIEQGHASPQLDTLVRSADAIGVPPRDLVG